MAFAAAPKSVVEDDGESDELFRLVEHVVGCITSIESFEIGNCSD